MRRSMRTPIYRDALALSENWYFEERFKIKGGTFVPTAGVPFAKLVEKTLVSMQAAKKAKRYIEGTASCLGKGYYVCRFFGKLPVDQITSRTWDDFRAWLGRARAEEGKPAHSERSVNQMKNAVRLVLWEAYRQRLIENVPLFKDTLRPKEKGGLPRTHFSETEYAALLKASRANIRAHKKAKTRWIPDAEELHDYIIFMVNTGLRVGECAALRFRDVKIVEASVAIKGKEKRREVCEIAIVGGKLGKGPACVSYLSAPRVYRRLVKRRGIEDPAASSEPLFRRHHRDAFKRLLRENNLRFDQWDRRRDFVSLRHTYICFRLKAGVPVFAVAKNVRTSVTMIENHYAKSLDTLSLAVNVTH